MAKIVRQVCWEGAVKIWPGFNSEFTIQILSLSSHLDFVVSPSQSGRRRTMEAELRRRVQSYTFISPVNIYFTTIKACQFIKEKGSNVALRRLFRF